MVGRVTSAEVSGGRGGRCVTVVTVRGGGGGHSDGSPGVS